MAADAAVSAGVMLAGFAIYMTGLGWIDPLTSIIIALVILIATGICCASRLIWPFRSPTRNRLR